MAREKAEKEKQERAARKKAIIDMNPSETQEGVMDRYLFKILIEKFFINTLNFFLVFWKLFKLAVLLVESRKGNADHDLLAVSFIYLLTQKSVQ